MSLDDAMPSQGVHGGRRFILSIALRGGGGISGLFRDLRCPYRHLPRKAVSTTSMCYRCNMFRNLHFKMLQAIGSDMESCSTLVLL